MRTGFFRAFVERLSDAVALARPTLLVPLWSIHLIAALRSEGWSFFWLPSAEFLLLSGSHTCFAAAAYIVNQLTDIESDRVNGKLFLLADGLVSRRFAYIEAAALAAAGTALAAARGKADAPLLLLILSVVLGAAYSLPPFRLKARAGLDLIANSVGYGSLSFALIGFEAMGAAVWVNSLPYALCVGSVFVLTAVPDLEGDVSAGYRTVVSVLGKRRAMVLGALLLLLALAAAAWQRDPVIFAAAAVFAPFYARSLVRIRRDETDRSPARASQAGVLTLCAAAACFAPWYALCVGLIAVWARVYYGKRFGMRYP